MQQEKTPSKTVSSVDYFTRPFSNASYLIRPLLTPKWLTSLAPWNLQTQIRKPSKPWSLQFISSPTKRPRCRQKPLATADTALNLQMSVSLERQPVTSAKRKDTLCRCNARKHEYNAWLPRSLLAPRRKKHRQAQSYYQWMTTHNGAGHRSYGLYHFEGNSQGTPTWCEVVKVHLVLKTYTEELIKVIGQLNVKV